MAWPCAFLGSMATGTPRDSEMTGGEAVGPPSMIWDSRVGSLLASDGVTRAQ